MEIHSYIEIKANIQNSLLEFLDDETNEDFSVLFMIIPEKTLPLLEYREELKALLTLILKISNNHHHYNGFFNKIKQILMFIKEDINQTFTASEIFKIFKSNKRVILILFETGIIPSDETIANLIIEKSNWQSSRIILFKADNKNDTKYCHYFYPEIKNFIDKEKRSIIESEVLKIDPQIFDKNRKIGENDSYICELIRNDSVEEFISYVNKTNLPLTITIPQSIFETNQFLINKEPSLIEYAAFFGSIQIFQYLKMCQVSLSSSLWLYVIHGNKPELIHSLEENGVKPEDKTYYRCLEESIKCHHNDIANYIKNNCVNQKVEAENIKKNFNENSLAFCFHYYNYACLPVKLKGNFILFYLCQYNHYKLVTLFVKNKGLDLQKRI